MQEKYKEIYLASEITEIILRLSVLSPNCLYERYNNEN